MKNKDFDTSIVCMNGMQLERTDCFKYLGVILDSNITWTQHISYIKNKVSKGIGIMYKARQYLDKKALLNIYYSYIYPYFIYCIEVWGNASHCHLHPLFLLQKKIIRIMTFSPYLAHTETLFINGGSNYDSLFVRTVAFPVQVAYWIKEVIAPCGYSVPCQF